MTNPRYPSYAPVYYRVAGYPQPVLRFIPGIAACGNIVDGVALEHGNEGVFIVAYADLIDMAERARAAREQL